MPWTVPSRAQTSVSHWDASYAADPGKWINPRAGDKDRSDEVMDLIGSVHDKSILDLGGGPLMAHHLVKSPCVVLVDFSQEACRQAQAISPRTKIVCADVMTYLSNCTDRFDIVLALGILDYMPPTGLDLLFDRAPSKLLIVNTPICEGYLHQYDTRITVYSRDDIKKAANRHGWKLSRRLPQKEHEFARYRRSD